MAIIGVLLSSTNWCDHHHPSEWTLWANFLTNFIPPAIHPPLPLLLSFTSRWHRVPSSPTIWSSSSSSSSDWLMLFRSSFVKAHHPHSHPGACSCWTTTTKATQRENKRTVFNAVQLQLHRERLIWNWNKIHILLKLTLDHRVFCLLVWNEQRCLSGAIGTVNILGRTGIAILEVIKHLRSHHRPRRF